MDRSIENIMATLMHEMMHYYCYLNGIQDTLQNHRYYNQKFKAEAEKRGLYIAQAKYIGWSVTTPSPAFVTVLRENGIEKPLDINRDGDMLERLGGLLGGFMEPDGKPVVGVSNKAFVSTVY